MNVWLQDDDSHCEESEKLPVPLALLSLPLIVKALLSALPFKIHNKSIPSRHIPLLSTPNPTSIMSGKDGHVQRSQVQGEQTATGAPKEASTTFPCKRALSTDVTLSRIP